MLIIGFKLLGRSVQVPHLKVSPVRVSRPCLSQWPTSIVADGPSRHLKDAMRQAGGSERSACPAHARSRHLEGQVNVCVQVWAPPVSA